MASELREVVEQARDRITALHKRYSRLSQESNSSRGAAEDFAKARAYADAVMLINRALAAVEEGKQDG